MKITKRICCIILAVWMVLSLVACATETPGTDMPGVTENNGTPSTGNGNKGKKPKLDGSFVIGLSAPMTGPAAIYGNTVKNSAQMAIDEINAAGGLYGATFELVVADDEHDETKVSAGYEYLMSKGMQVSLGCVTSSPCLEFARLSKEDNVFFLTPSASNDDVVEHSNAYQMCFADGNQGAVAANYVNSLGISKVGILYQSDFAYYSGQICQQFKDTLNDEIVTVEASFTGGTTDFTSQVAQLSDCSFIFMPIYHDPAYLFMLDGIGVISPDAVYHGCDAFEVLEYAGDLSPIPQKITMLSNFDAKATDGKAAEFAEKYIEMYGIDTFNWFGASAYDCVYAIYGAMKAALDAGKKISTDISASALCDILKEQFNGGYTFSGVTDENIQWQSNGYVDKAGIALVIKEKNV